MFYLNASEDVLRKVIDMRIKYNAQQVVQAIDMFHTQIGSFLGGVTATDPSVSARIEVLKLDLSTNSGKSISESIYAKYRAAFEILAGMQSEWIT